MLAGQRVWIDLLNAQDGWVTDESMLDVISEEAREFESAPNWPRHKALAFLHNNATALRAHYQQLEAGEPLDVDLMNPILDSIRLRFVDWRQHSDWGRYRQERRGGDRLVFLSPVKESEGWNRGAAALRAIIQRSFYHFALYADSRLADPCYPGATPGTFRVLQCPGPRCTALVPCPIGQPDYCSETCSEDTGRLDG